MVKARVTLGLFLCLITVIFLIANDFIFDLDYIASKFEQFQIYT
ncbi:hypothetical protein [Desertibacillus haloalkaliphilus]|nr:hypothetical protein [Desertibacillus haloalkaliphilus]